MRRKSVLLAALLLAATSAATAGSFDAHHPDQYYRQRAAIAFDQGRYAAALKDFERSARYADKASQLALAMAYWNGDGVTADPATAYAWADVAAERGYPAFLAARERMWEHMTEAQRDAALEIGAKLQRKYGDAAGKKRLESHMKRGLVQKTGTRTGSHVANPSVATVNFAGLAAMRAGTSSSAAGNSGPGAAFASGNVRLASRLMTSLAAFGEDGYYGDDRWVPKVYWARQDRHWRSLDEGVVEVGPLTTAHPQGARG